jgi:hypothetical protein
LIQQPFFSICSSIALHFRVTLSYSCHFLLFPFHLIHSLVYCLNFTSCLRSRYTYFYNEVLPGGGFRRLNAIRLRIPRHEDITIRPKKRIAQAGTVDGNAPAELIGDPVAGATTPTGKIIANISTGSESGQSSAGGYFPSGVTGTAACEKEMCCICQYVSMAMTAAFLGPTGRCNDLARAAICLGFHDAGAWKRGMTSGGADGSIVLAPAEISRADNKGLEGIVAKAKDFQKQCSPYSVGIAPIRSHLCCCHLPTRTSSSILRGKERFHTASTRKSPTRCLAIS